MARFVSGEHLTHVDHAGLAEVLLAADQVPVGVVGFGTREPAIDQLDGIPGIRVVEDEPVPVSTSVKVALPSSFSTKVLRPGPAMLTVVVTLFSRWSGWRPLEEGAEPRSLRRRSRLLADHVDLHRESAFFDHQRVLHWHRQNPTFRRIGVGRSREQRHQQHQQCDRQHQRDRRRLYAASVSDRASDHMTRPPAVVHELRIRGHSAERALVPTQAGWPSCAAQIEAVH